MRSQRAYGRPGTAVIPPGWGASHAPVAAGTMTATVALRAPGSTAVWDEGLGRTVVTPNSPFAEDVPARIRAIAEARTAGSERDAADVDVRVAGYLVSLPLTGDGVDALVVDGESNTLIDVTTSDDPLLTGKTLRAQDIVRGSLRFERDLLCTLTN